MKNFKKLIKGNLLAFAGIIIFLTVLLVVCMFCANYRTVEDLIAAFLFFILFLGLAYLVVFIYMIALWVSYEKAKNRVRSIPGFSEERFDREVARAPKIQNMLVCSDAICFYNGLYFVRTIPLRDIVWAYQEQSQNLVGIKVFTRDGECHSVPVMIKRKVGTGDAASRYLLRLIARKNKGVMIGYNEAYEKMFKKNFQQFMQEMKPVEIVDSRLLEQEYIQNDYYSKDFQ